jgi:phosphoglycerate dehydrogenase-like enzyme
MQEVHSWDPLLYTCNRQSLQGKTIGILGVGEIGSQIANASTVLGLLPIGLRRSKMDEESRSVSSSFLRITDDMDDILRSSDFVINCLPSTLATRRILSLEKFELCVEKRPLFINIGRGDITTTGTIAEAITKGYISHAVLDVFDQEPLDPSDAAWDNPHISITPHISAVSTAAIVAKVFVSNLDKFVRGDPLDYVVDFSRGY